MLAISNAAPFRVFEPPRKITTQDNGPIDQLNTHLSFREETVRPIRPNMRPSAGDSTEGGRHRIRRRRIGVALALAAAVFAAACSSSGGSSTGGASFAGAAGGTAAGSTINIGLIADLTGATTFPEGVDGAKAAVAAV